MVPENGYHSCESEGTCKYIIIAGRAMLVYLCTWHSGRAGGHGRQ